MEALFRLCWQAFEHYLEDHQAMTMASADRERLACALNKIRVEHTKRSLWQVLVLPAFADLQEAFVCFLATLKSPLSQLWLSYIQMVHLLLQFLRASRTGNWYLHMVSVRRMLS